MHLKFIKITEQLPFISQVSFSTKTTPDELRRLARKVIMTVILHDIWFLSNEVYSNYIVYNFEDFTNTKDNPSHVVWQQFVWW